MELLGFYCTVVHEIWYLSIFRKSIQESQVPLKYVKNNGTLCEGQFTFFIVSRSFLLRMRKFSNKCCRWNRNTHFLFNFFFSRKSCRLLDNVEICGGAGQATDEGHVGYLRLQETHSEYVVLVVFPLQQQLRKRSSMLRYTYVSCLAYFNFIARVKPFLFVWIKCMFCDQVPVSVGV